MFNEFIHKAAHYALDAGQNPSLEVTDPVLKIYRKRSKPTKGFY